MKTTLRILLACALPLATSAFGVTISGTDLSSLHYSPSGGVAQYVAGTPDVADLYTDDSGLSLHAGDPAVFVKAVNLGLPSMGTLNTLSASYSLSVPFTGPSGVEPYWLTYLYAPGGGYIGVVSMGGPDLNASTDIHVFYDYATSPLTSDTYWGKTLSYLDSTAYGSTTFGQMEVYETAVEIGDWDNGIATIPAEANIQSITVNVPDAASAAGLLGLALTGLAGFRRWVK